MNIGDTVVVMSQKGFERFGTIAAVGVLSHCSHGRSCVRIGEIGCDFYIEPDLETGKHYKVDDKTLWIRVLPAIKTPSEANYFLH